MSSEHIATSPSGGALSLGRWRADVVHAGTFGLDGGAMFGVVPRPVWAKKLPPDSANRVPLSLTCLLLRDGERTVLIDNGMGTRWADDERERFDLQDSLEQGLATHGVSPGDITDLVLTHLHFDHAGGSTKEQDGEVVPVFENARVHVGTRAWAWANTPTKRDRRSYRVEDWRVYEQAGRMVRHSDAPDELVEILPDFHAIFCDGHTTGQLVPVIGDATRRLVFASDVVPTQHHIRLAWNMGFDLRPLDLMRDKQRVLRLCCEDGALLLLQHDRQVSVCSVTEQRGDYALAEVVVAGCEAASGERVASHV